MKCNVEFWEDDEYVICVTEPDLGLVGSTFHKRDANIIKSFIEDLDKKIQEKKEKSEEVEIELTEKEFNVLANMAHQRDITFNELCNNVLREQIEKLEKAKPIKKVKKGKK